jgi:NAD(P)-dependent dehydrogenase (short-subunit alcohol dehydrogenase family)
VSAEPLEPARADLRGQVAVVTGASRGIGFAIAQRLSRCGAAVALVARTAESLRAAAAKLPSECRTFAADATDPESATQVLDAVADSLGPPTILVNNAGGSTHYGPLVEAEVAQVRAAFELNVVGPMCWSRAFCAARRPDGPGSIVNVSSISGVAPSRKVGLYGISKAALLHFTRQLAVELAPEIRVNAVAPGMVETDMSRSAVVALGVRAWANIPLQRIATAQDVAACVAFLAGPDAAFITGETVIIDGGLLKAWPA